MAQQAKVAPLFGQLRSILAMQFPPAATNTPNRSLQSARRQAAEPSLQSIRQCHRFRLDSLPVDARMAADFGPGVTLQRQKPQC
jgi:hypothetical protein